MTRKDIEEAIRVELAKARPIVNVRRLTERGGYSYKPLRYSRVPDIGEVIKLPYIGGPMDSYPPWVRVKDVTHFEDDGAPVYIAANIEVE